MPMRIPLLFLTILAGFCFPQTEGETTGNLEDLSISALQTRLSGIQSELDALALWGMRSGTGSNGDRSVTHSDGAHEEWFEIRLDQEQEIDSVVLVPHISRDSKRGLRADGFPFEIKILAGKTGDPEGQVIGRYSTSFPPQEHIAPVIFPLNTPVQATWIRVVATKLSPRAWDGLYNFQLSEILVFSGENEVALNSTVLKSSVSRGYSPSRDPAYLVDGFMPYFMDSRKGSSSFAFIEDQFPNETIPTLIIDLGAIEEVDRIHLHPLELSDNIPLNHQADYAIPRRIAVEGATRADFSDAVPLLEMNLENPYHIGPIIMRRIPQTSCRYLRFIVTEPYVDTLSLEEPAMVLGLAEIEVFSDSKNVALGKWVEANFPVTRAKRQLSALTDGMNFFGTILPLKEWVTELARRHELERLHPEVRMMLSKRHTEQQHTLRRLVWLAVILAAGIIVALLGSRIVRHRQIAEIRERFAADLHDDLGASLHTIGLLGDVALASIDSPERLETALSRTRELTKRTSIAVRHCSDMQRSQSRLEHMEEAIRRTSTSILTGIEHRISFEGERHFKALGMRLKMDLFLFIKEALINVVRHSGATKVEIDIKATNREIELLICNNGSGLPASMGNRVPPSLVRRADLLKGSVSIEDSETWATVIHLTRRRNPLRFWESLL
ncbi:MAG: hypothetical protein ACSHX9_01220 [Luteolibacter sp.]